MTDINKVENFEPDCFILKISSEIFIGARIYTKVHLYGKYF